MQRRIEQDSRALNPRFGDRRSAVAGTRLQAIRVIREIRGRLLPPVVPVVPVVVNLPAWLDPLKTSSSFLQPFVP